MIANINSNFRLVYAKQTIPRVSKITQYVEWVSNRIFRNKYYFYWRIRQKERVREKKRERDRETERERQRETERETERGLIKILYRLTSFVHFWPIFPFLCCAPWKTRKPKVFWYFQGLKNENIDQKWV